MLDSVACPQPIQVIQASDSLLPGCPAALLCPAALQPHSNLIGVRLTAMLPFSNTAQMPGSLLTHRVLRFDNPHTPLPCFYSLRCLAARCPAAVLPTLGSCTKPCPCRVLGGSSPVVALRRHSMIVCRLARRAQASLGRCLKGDVTVWPRGLHGSSSLLIPLAPATRQELYAPWCDSWQRAPDFRNSTQPVLALPNVLPCAQHAQHNPKRTVFPAPLDPTMMVRGL